MVGSMVLFGNMPISLVLTRVLTSNLLYCFRFHFVFPCWSDYCRVICVVISCDFPDPKCREKLFFTKCKMSAINPQTCNHKFVQMFKTTFKLPLCLTDLLYRHYLSKHVSPFTFVNWRWTSKTKSKNRIHTLQGLFIFPRILIGYFD